MSAPASGSSARCFRVGALAGPLRRRTSPAERELLLRLASALVLIPASLLFTWYSEVAFALLTVVVGGLVFFEWLRMVGSGHLTALHLAGWGVLGLTAAAALLAPWPLLAGPAVLCLSAPVFLLLARGGERPARWVLLGLLYAGVAVAAMVTLRRGEDGFGVVVFVFLIAWVSDSFAFFVGRRFGGPKLWRRVSPSKTWSGAAGGFAGGVAVGVAAAGVLNDVPLTLTTVLVAALISIAAQAGDLLESALKRHFDCKDAGSLIPGHGGVMDRVDGLIAASVLTAVLGAIIMGDDAAAGFLSLMGR